MNALVIFSKFNRNHKREAVKRIDNHLINIFVQAKEPMKSIRGYSFVKEIMQPEKQFIKEQKEAIAQANEIKKSAYLLASYVETSKLSRKYSNIINFLTKSAKQRLF